ncbi:MYND-type domain-containing protein [Mycena kentingensis (nom. inval.)]|nr:MYND-type domain-containing protein [Mycena kentingensis (nom. inval.)]
MVHPCFDRAHLRKLPIQFRNLGLAAASGSVDSLERLIAILGRDRARKDVLDNVLPAFSSAILAFNPTTQLSATPPDQQGESIRRILWSIRGVEHIIAQEAMSVDAFLEIWPHIWSFVKLVVDLQNNDALPEVISGARRTAWIDHGLICGIGALSWTLAHQPSHRNLRELQATANTPGLAGIVGRIWARTLARQMPEMEPLYAILQIIVVHGIAHLYRDDPAPFRELMLGAGGDWDALAKLIVQHMQRHTERKRAGNRHTGQDLTSIDGLLNMLSVSTMEPAFADALTAQGIIPALVTIVVDVAEDHLNEDFNELPTLAWGYLAHTFDHARFEIGMPKALRAGLLEASLRYSALSPDAYMAVEELWFKQLPLAALNRTIMPRLVRAFSPKRTTRMQDLVQRLRLPSLGVQLQNLSALTDQRREFLADFRAGKLTRYLACDNIDCGAILEKASMQRCSGCFSRHYCSRACQKSAWRQEPHREVCAASRVAYLRALNLKKTEGALAQTFLRALINSRYYALRETLLLRSIRMLWNANIAPDPVTQRLPPLYVLFDTTKQLGWIKASLHLEPPSGAERYADAISVAGARMPGRFGLHFLRLRESEGGLAFVPLRRETTRWEDGLSEIMREVSRKGEGGGGELDVEVYRERVKVIVEELGAETH